MNSTIAPTAADFDRVGALAALVESFLGDGACQNCGCGCPVTSLLVRVVGHILDQFGANVLVLAFQLDRFSHRDAVLGDFRTAPTLFDDHVPTLGVSRRGK